MGTVEAKEYSDAWSRLQKLGLLPFAADLYAHTLPDGISKLDCPFGDWTNTAAQPLASYRERLLAAFVEPNSGKPKPTNTQAKFSDDLPNLPAGHRDFVVSLFPTFKRFGKPIHLMEEDDFLNHYRPLRPDEYKFPSIDAMYSLYKRNQYASVFKQFDRAVEPSSGPALRADYEQRFPPPWTAVDRAFLAVRELSDDPNFFDFQLTNPSDESLDMNNWKSYQFKSKLRHTKTGDVIPAGSLSSGEAIILALILLVHSWTDGKAFPRVLLLDEVDASLHPSTTRILVQVLNQMSKDLGVSVIVATHSPTTVALAPDNALFEVKGRFEKPRLAPIGRQSLLDILTEGYFTIQMASVLCAEMLKGGTVVVSEGNNAKHIKHALDVLGVSGVNVIGTFTQRSGDSQLRTVFDFFSSIPGHGPMLFVWDCDARGKSPRKEQNNTYAFYFDQNADNELAPTGIENLYDDEVLTGFASETRRPGGQVHRSIGGKEKATIAEHICTLRDPAVFRRFTPLVERLRALSAIS